MKSFSRRLVGSLRCSAVIVLLLAMLLASTTKVYGQGWVPGGERSFSISGSPTWLDIKPSELVQTLGVVLCATSLTLTASLLFFGLLDGPRAIVSAAAVVPALVGMWVGQRIRLRLSVEQFRLAVLWALLLTGVYTFASRVL